ncbi:MAG: hypothetical protein EXR27_07795 [Betaproteobacteria bacterium]|nr:hypothetical protein [Betaproteobacteria bacterium]
MPVYAAAVFLSAFLLFQVQPIIARQILPWFGGTAAVWAICMVFFQFGLLGGYAYADWMARRAAPRKQALIHGTLLFASLAFLPLSPNPAFKPSGADDPGVAIVLVLLVSIGLPYFLLSATSPLVQVWFARRFPGAQVYRLFALSNAASLLALVSYPFIIEPWISSRDQSVAWSAGYAFFVLFCIAAARMAAVASPAAATMASAATAPESPHDDAHAGRPGVEQYALWLCLSALGTVMLLAVTNHMTQNIASIPFLWLLPLTLYLLTFILSFEGRGWYRRTIFVLPFLVAVPAMAWGLQTHGAVMPITEAVPLYAVTLFVACMFFHGELAGLKPATAHLTRFYFMISLGGAIGGLFVGLLAPRLFPTYYEFPLALVVAGLVAAYLLRALPKVVLLAALVSIGTSSYYSYQYLEMLNENTRVMVRSFFGALRVTEKDAGEVDSRVRRLIHGVIMHGEQYLDPALLAEPTSYYARTSGIARVLAAFEGAPRRIGVIGLGVGTLAAYGRKGDVVRFYEIDANVIDIAQREFTYIRDSGARVEFALGDARLSLERDAPQALDVLAVDAFSSDAIPVHLITREALQVYLRHIRPGGVVAFHVTNRYLRLAPVVKLLAEAEGWDARVVEDEGEKLGSSSDWVLVTKNKALFDNPNLKDVLTAIDVPPDLPVWTDDFNNLFRVLK